MGQITVLIIDENSDVRALLARGLSAFPGFKVIGVAGNPMLGAELAHELQPDVILADFRRTGPPRVETFRWISRVSPRSRLVVLTSYFSRGEEQACLDAGASVCLLKGMTLRDLAGELKVITAREKELTGAKGNSG